MSNKKKLEVTKVFHRIKEAHLKGYRNIVLQGGSRSSKTYSLCQYLITLGIQSKEPLKIDIVRKSFPSLRASVMRDFFEVLNSLGIYDENNHNKTTNTYTINNTTFCFYSLDDEQKIRGVKRDIAFLNEANELGYEEYQQINLRTSKTLFFDFNPSDPNTYLQDIQNDKESSFTIHSTYKDNNFLTAEQIKEFEKLQFTDESYWQIFGLGKFHTSKAKIFNHYKEYSLLPENISDITYGLDFGWIHPTSLVKCYWSFNGECFAEVLLYESYLTTHDIVNKIQSMGISSMHTIYADHSVPEKISELKASGLNVENANKNVKAGLDKMKSTPLFIKDTSIKLLDELKKYRYKVDHNGKVTEDVVKLQDDAIDALRYAIMGKTAIKKYSGQYLIY